MAVEVTTLIVSRQHWAFTISFHISFPTFTIDWRHAPQPTVGRL
jgi:hypothetical protein